MADTEIPKDKTYKDGKPIPPVDPEDIKRCWRLKPPWSPGNDPESVCSFGADVAAVLQRWHMLTTLNIYELLGPWQHGEELDDAVFQIAATFPLRELRRKSYEIPGDELFGFDPNAFLQHLTEETRVSHVWEPVPRKIPEGKRLIGPLRTVSRRDPSTGKLLPMTERDTKDQARQVVWYIWKRFSPLNNVLSDAGKETACEMVARFFGNFLLDNIDLVRQLEDSHWDLVRQAENVSRDRAAAKVAILSELERRAQGQSIF